MVMAGLRFINCADIHLDSPLRGLSAQSSALVEEMRSTTWRAQDNLTRLAVKEQVDFVVIASSSHPTRVRGLRARQDSHYYYQTHMSRAIAVGKPC